MGFYIDFHLYLYLDFRQILQEATIGGNKNDVVAEHWRSAISSKGKAFIIHKAKGSRYARRILSSLHFSRFFLSLESRERKTQRGERKREATPKVKGSWGGKVSVGNAAESSEGQFGHFYAHLRHFRRRTLVIGDGDFQCWISHRRHGLRRTRLDRCRCLFH